MDDIQHAHPGEGLRADAVRNRDALLAAARHCLACGDDTLAMNALAKDAGVGVGTAYRHFPNRQVLLEALAVDSFDKLIVIAREIAEDPDTVHALEQLIGSAIELQLDDPGLAAVLASETPTCPDTKELFGELGQLISQVLARGVHEGVISAALDAADIKHLICGTTFAVRTAGRDSLNTYVQVLVKGLRA